MLSALLPAIVSIQLASPSTNPILAQFQDRQLLAYRELSLDNRYSVKSVNDVFKDNILLNMAYLRDEVKDKKNINWDQVQKPFKYEMVLMPNETFSYHNNILDEYKGKVNKTLDINFGAQDGFKTDGYLYGDGVCHLASLINWAARDAKLEVKSPVNHDFAPIPDVPKEYGVSIYSQPNSSGSTAMQNLYITNSFKYPVMFSFDYADNKLKLSIFKISDMKSFPYTTLNNL